MAEYHIDEMHGLMNQFAQRMSKAATDFDAQALELKRLIAELDLDEGDR